MDTGHLRFEVTKSKISWGTYLQDLITGKPQGAEDRTAVTESDVHSLEAAAWRERYDVPLSFVGA